MFVPRCVAIFPPMPSDTAHNPPTSPSIIRPYKLAAVLFGLALRALIRILAQDVLVAVLQSLAVGISGVVDLGLEHHSTDQEDMEGG